MADLRLSQVPLDVQKQTPLAQVVTHLLSFVGDFGSKMLPALAPEALPPAALATARGRTSYSQPANPDFHDGSRRPPTRSSSSLSIPFADEEVDVVRVEGLRHADGRLEARRYKTAPFADELLRIVQSLRVPAWSHRSITADALKIQKVSGSLTNAVFFVSCPSVPHTPILLLRIYGPSSGALISRPRELHILHALSSQYQIGPQVYGTFENGRVEEYFDSNALTAEDLRDPQISSWIGTRMAELHQVDIATVDLPPESSPEPPSEKGGPCVSVKANVKSWIPFSREVLALPAATAEFRAAMDLDKFEAEWEQYTQWLQEWESREGASPVVFAHNDAQYGNLLKLTRLPRGMPEHRQIIVVDFEYASPNPAAFDIANHFHEWTANYHGSTPHVLDPARYPTPAERDNFYRAYLAGCTQGPAASAAELRMLDAQVRAWSPASHGMWALWGIVQAREALDGTDGEPEFDYVGYARGRMEGFRREVARLMSQ